MHLKYLSIIYRKASDEVETKKTATKREIGSDFDTSFKKKIVRFFIRAPRCFSECRW